ncbi:MAG: polyprenyl synthetase family protein [Deltaproteobacteria bacterium]|nr:polyprenyl synthetase family protein [Deltaproteobacteria bacterium]
MTTRKTIDTDKADGGVVGTRAPGQDPVEAFEQLLERVRRDVDARLAGYLDARVAETARHGADVEAMASAVRDLTLRGGKRIRPALLVVGFLAADDTQSPEAALDAGVALELLQTYLLVHDDWMDGDDMRRGGPSVPAMMRKHHGTSQQADAASILAGDYASALAMDVLSRLDTQSDRLLKVLGLFAQIEQDVICGQQLDVSGQVGEVESYYALKTGSYTVRGPLVLGATLAAAQPQIMAALEEYGAPLGIAFQMQDDLLGTFGDTKRTGKPVGEDLRRGKHTIISHEARKILSSAEIRKFERVFGNANATAQAIRDVTQMLEDKGVLKAVVKRIDQLANQAVSALVDVPISDYGRTWLLGAASIIAARLD